MGGGSTANGEAEADVFAGMSPVDALRLRTELVDAGRANQTEEEKQANARRTKDAVLDATPIIGNIRSAQSAKDTGSKFVRKLHDGEWKEAAKAGGLFGLDVLGAQTGVSFSRLAGKEAAKDASRTARIFAGPTAKTADHTALARAQEMHKAGADRADIWRETGWFQGPEGKWRFEIPDNDAKLGQYATDTVKTPNATPTVGSLYQDFEHPQFRAAYPDSEKITQSIGYGRGTGAYWDNRDHLEIRARNPHEAKSIGLHELQHRVQRDEGFAPGGDMFASPAGHEAFWAEKSRLYQEMLDDPKLTSVMDSASIFRLAHERAKENLNRDWYRRNAGEVEARNVETRQHFDPESRRESPPWETQDVPEDQVIVNGLFKGAPQEVFMPAPPSKNADFAYKLREQGARNETVAKKTGLHFGPEGILRSEAVDYNVPVNTGKIGVRPGEVVPLKTVFPHHGLFSHHKDLGEMPLQFKRLQGSNGADVARLGDQGYPVLPIGKGEAWEREQIAKLLQYQMGKKAGFSRAVTHNVDKELAGYQDSVRRVQDIIDNPRPGDDLEAAMLWQQHAEPLFKRMSEASKNRNNSQMNRFSKRVAGNAEAREVRDRSYGHGKGVYPYKHEQWIGLTALPQKDLTREQLSAFLKNWREYGVGRDLFGGL